MLLALSGCQGPTKDPIRASAAALDQGDCDQAIVLANEAIEEDGPGPKAAHALYLRGRAYEQRPAPSQSAMLANLQAARTSYVEALRYNPPSELQTYLRASLGKVAFYQDDFATAWQQLWVACQELKDKELRAAALYHLGKTQQRTGQFADADQTFASIISTYPDSGWAKKAQESRGARAFYLQLATYSNAELMESAAKLVKARGLQPVRLKDDQGRLLLRAGPFDTYAQAKQNRPKLADPFRDATIVP